MTAYYVYIMASQRNGTLYVGITRDIAKRAYEHRNGLVEGFTKRYDVKHLVYWESHTTPTDAIAREKRLKEWPRKWKLDLIERSNPDWNDLYDELLHYPPGSRDQVAG